MSLTKDDLVASSRAYRLHQLGLKVDGTMFSLRDYPWIIDILDTDHPDVSMRKGAQLGFTVAMILRTIDMSRFVYDRGVLYLMPTRDDVADFAKTRFDRFLKENHRTLGALIQGTDSVGVKRIGNSFIYFRGAKSRSQLKSIPVDALYTDEEDEMDPAMVELAEHRLDGSRYKHHFRLSTPSIPEFGIDYHWIRSDQRHWMIKCSGCGAYTCLELEFPDCLKRRPDRTVFRACSKCDKEIFPIDGEWVAQNASQEEHRGHYISQLNSPTISPATVLDEWESGDLVGERLQEFYNSRLGQPYADIEDLLDERTLRAVCGEYVREFSNPGPCFMGVDIGKKSHHYQIGYKVGDKRFNVIDYGETDFAGLSEKIKRYNVAVACFDMMAEMHAVRAFQEKHTQVWGVIYSEAQRNTYDWQAKEQKVTVNRTELMDQSHRSIISEEVRFFRPGDDWPVFVKHMTNLARVVIRDDKTGTPKVRWVVRGRKMDHLRHAFGYLVLAGERAPLSSHHQRVTRSHTASSPHTTWMSN